MPFVVAIRSSPRTRDRIRSRSISPATGSIHVVATDGGGAVPARVQIRPAAGQTVPKPPDVWGETDYPGDRLHVAFATTGDVTLPVPPGNWKVIVSRGYEYELDEDTRTVTAGATDQTAFTLTRVVDTTGIQCGDFHVHTWRQRFERCRNATR